MYRPGIADRAAWRMRRFLRHHPAAGSTRKTNGPIHVIGMFSTASGLGQSARACADALEASGVTVHRTDISGMLNQTEYSGGGAGTSNRLLPGDNGIAIVHVNPPEFDRVLFWLGLRNWHNWRVIAYWAWELERVPESWRKAVSLASEIWTPSEFVSDAFRRSLGAQARTVPHFVTPPSGGRAERKTGAPFRCLIMADGRSSFYRKNVEGSIRAFTSAFGADAPARLTVKCRNLREFPGTERWLRDVCANDSRIDVHDENWSRDRVWDVMQASDAIISCHRAEGFGLHLAEAMALGKVVVATDWSGNTQFMNTGNAMLVPYELQAVEDPTAIYACETGSNWALADIRAAAGMLRGLAASSDLCARIGHAASRDIKLKLGAERYRDALYAPSCVDPMAPSEAI